MSVALLHGDYIYGYHMHMFRWTNNRPLALGTMQLLSHVISRDYLSLGQVPST